MALLNSDPELLKQPLSCCCLESQVKAWVMCVSSMKMKARAWAKDLSTKAVSLIGEGKWGDEGFCSDAASSHEGFPGSGPHSCVISLRLSECMKLGSASCYSEVVFHPWSSWMWTLQCGSAVSCFAFHCCSLVPSEVSLTPAPSS